MVIHVYSIIYFDSIFFVCFFFCLLFSVLLHSYRYSSAPTSEEVNDIRTICKLFFADHPGEIVGMLIIY